MRALATLFVSVGVLVGCAVSSTDTEGQPPAAPASGDAGSGTVSAATGGQWAGSAGSPSSGGAAGTQTTTGGAAGTSGQGSGGTVATGSACNNAADLGILSAVDVSGSVGSCALQNLAAEPATRNCISQATGLSDACVTCFDGEAQCATQNCLSQCMANANGPDCASCRKQYCDPAFATCSGLTV